MLFFSLLFFCSCKRTPSNKDIEKKILVEYACPEKANVNGLEIVKTAPATSLFGLKGYEYEYIVSGEVECPSGCTDFSTSLPPGYKEKFENKRVVLLKGEEGWQ